MLVFFFLTVNVHLVPFDQAKLMSWLCRAAVVISVRIRTLCSLATSVCRPLKPPPHTHTPTSKYMTSFCPLEMDDPTWIILFSCWRVEIKSIDPARLNIFTFHTFFFTLLLICKDIFRRNLEPVFHFHVLFCSLTRILDFNRQH